LSLRFALDERVQDRLVVVSSLGSDELDLPVETVTGLVVGTVATGRLVVAANTLGECPDGAPGCPPTGRRSASSAILDLLPDEEVDQAVLLWRGEVPPTGSLAPVGLIPPTVATATVVTARSEVRGPEQTADGFRAVADVTSVVRGGGPGRYTVVRAPSVDDPGDGSWSLLVVTRVAGQPRRLIVSIDPASPAVPDVPIVTIVPVKSADPAGPPRSPGREGELRVGALGDGAVVRVDGVEVPPEPSAGPGPLDVTYDLRIDADADAIQIDVTSSTRPLTVAFLGLAVDIVT
jgi:hypothetical protein